jgi:tetratricopeptide (TPR) repeat protein
MEERLDVLERLAMLEADPEVRRRVLGTAAVLATHLGQHERAIWAWEACLKMSPTDGEALDGLVDLFGQAQRWRSLIDVLRQRAATDRPRDQQLADRVRVAQILSQQLGETDEAIASWREVEESFGETPESTQALSSLLRAARRWAELAQLLRRAAGQAPDSAERANVLCELGDVQREHLDAVEDAIESYRASLDANPSNANARAGLRALLARPEHRAAAVAVLLKAYRATHEWKNVLDLTEHRIATADSDTAKVEILREAATLSETRSGDPEAAFAHVRRAFLLDPGDDDVHAEIHRLAEMTKQWRSLADAQREALDAHDATGALPWLSKLRYSMGQVLETRLEDARAALNCYLRVATDDPHDLEAARAAVRVGARISRWDAAARVVAEACRAKGTLEESLVRAMEEGASLASAWDGATQALSAAVAERPELPPALARDLEALVALWHRDRRGDPESAETAFARALAHDPMNAELLSSLAQLQRRQKGRPLVDSLLRLSNATGGDLDLLREAAEIASSAISDRALAKSILEKLVKIATERWLGVDGADTLTTGAPASPAGYVQWGLQELVRIHTEEGDFDRVVELLVENAALPFPTETARAMRHEAAKIAHDKLGHIERAIMLYLALFEEDPDDAITVDRLVAIYEAAGRRNDLLELTNKRISSARTTQRKVALLREAALLHHQLGDDAGCIDRLRQALALDPREPTVVEELARQLERGGKFEQLMGLLADQATRAEAAGERGAAAEQWSRAAEVARTKLRDADQAILHYKRVIALEPRASALDALASLSTARGDFVAAAEFLEHLRSLVDASERPATTLRLADALLSAGRGEAARKRLEEAVESDPDAESVRTRLAEIYRSKEEWAPLAKLLTHGASHAPDKSTRLARLREAADLHRTRTGTPEEAVPLLEQASDLEPDDRAIKLALADALGAAGRFEEARALLRALVEGFAGRRPKERAPVHYHLARLDLAAGDRARALVELDQATKIDPANPEILRALAELARDDGQLERAERSYRALLAVVRRQDESNPSPAVVRCEVLLELSAIATRQGQPERAEEILESALEIASESELEGKRLERALRDRGDFATLVRTLEARIAKMGASPSAADAISELADVLDEKLQRPREAFESRLRALELAPTSDVAHASAKDLAKRLDLLPRYIDHVSTLAGNAEDGGNPAQACELHLRVGRVVEKDLGDDRRAARIYERAREYGMREDEILELLDGVYERLGDESAQARVLSARIERAQSGVGSDALYRLAALRMRSPDTVDEGCNLLVSALERSNDVDRAEAVLTAAAAAHPKNERILELYERIARTPGHEGALVDALTKRWSLAPTASDPLREAVDLARTRGDAALAESLLRRFLAKSNGVPEDVAWAKSSLAELREAAGDKKEALALKLEAADVADTDVSRRLRFEAARLADEIGDLVVAASTYERLHRLEPADREAWEPLLDVYRRGGNKQRLADLLGEVVEYVDENTERSRLRLERVELMMNDLGLGDAAAEPVLREIVDEDPSQVEAAILLSGILERQGNEEDLAGLLARQLEAAKDRNDAAAVASLSVRLGGLLEKRDHAEAKNVYYAGLDWDGKNRELLEALVKIHREDGDQTDAADAMERILLLEQGPAAEKLAIELASIRAELWDEPGAERALEYGFRAHPSSEALRERLETAYRDKSAWDKLAALYEIDAGGRESVAERVAKLRDAAAIHRLELNDHAAAIRVLRAAHEAAPDDVDTLGDLVDVLAASGDVAGAVAELTAALDRLAPNAPERSSLRASRARLSAKLGDDLAALEDWDAAVADVGGDVYAKELCAHLEKMAIRAAGAGDTPRWRALRLRLATLLPMTGQAEAARELLAELLKNDPRDREALRAQARLEEASEQWDAASATYRRLIALEEADTIVETALRLADACEKAGRLADARGGLERARLAAPQDATLRARVERIYEETGAFRELAELYLEEARGTGDVGGKFAQLLRAGSLFLDNGDAAAAIEPLKEAHQLRTGDLDCILRLIDAYTAAGNIEEATELCNATVTSYKGRRSKELGHLYHRLARIAGTAGDKQGELQHLTTALDMDSQNGVVASELAYVAMELASYEVATRALRTVTMLKVPAPLSKALAYQYLGEIARQQGDVKKAMLLLKRAIDDDPTLESARALLDALQAAGE